MVPTEKEKTQKNRRPARLTMPVKCVRGNRKRNSNNAIVVILVGDMTTTNQTSDKAV